MPRIPPHLMTLADLSPRQILGIVNHAHAQKRICLPWQEPRVLGGQATKLDSLSQSLRNKTIALLFSKRSTRTRVAAETAANLLGGQALFLGREDIQIGVNETYRDSARVIGGMCNGIFARVGAHEEIEEFAKYSPVPVMNALSSLWHPTQILADLLTLHENAHLFQSGSQASNQTGHNLPSLPPLTIAYVGDPANVLNDMLVTYPRLGHKMRVASPKAYPCEPRVWNRVMELGCDKGIWWGENPLEAVKGADVVITDTWVSMGQEAEKAERIRAFDGYQVTEAMCEAGGANPGWLFMHCLPRKEHEVDDEVFYGSRSLVFPEADNRKWTTLAAFDLLFGKWDLDVMDSD